MRRNRLICVLLALTLLVGLLCAPVNAASTFFFVAVDDAIPLTLTAPPHQAATGLYVPYTVFDASPGGVVPAYDAEKQTLVLFNRSQRLIFDIGSDTVTDENGDSSTVLTTYRNGLLYIPIALCASHFGMSYSMLTSADGYQVLRFTTGGAVYDDATFIEKAENLISYRVSQSETPGQTEKPPAQGPNTQQPPAEEPVHTPVSVYAAITDAAVMADAATVLEKNGLRAAFFLTEEEITKNGELVRRLYAAGHTLGLTVSAEETDPASALARANTALDATLCGKSLMALVTAAQADGLSGYRVFVRPEQQLTTDALLQMQDASVLLVCDSNAVRVITALNQAQLPVQQLRETTRLHEPNQTEDG